MASLRAIKTNIASDMTADINKLRTQLNALSIEQYKIKAGFHVPCLVHIVNLAVESCTSKVHDNLQKIRILLAAMRVGVTRRNLFEKYRKDLDVQWQVPNLDTKTSLSSTSLLPVVFSPHDLCLILPLVVWTSWRNLVVTVIE